MILIGLFLTAFVTAPIAGILFAVSIVLSGAGKGMNKKKDGD